jgi:hypothetical protein
MVSLSRGLPSVPSIHSLGQSPGHAHGGHLSGGGGQGGQAGHHSGQGAYLDGMPSPTTALEVGGTSSSFNPFAGLHAGLTLAQMVRRCLPLKHSVKRGIRAHGRRISCLRAGGHGPCECEVKEGRERERERERAV